MRSRYGLFLEDAHDTLDPVLFDLMRDPPMLKPEVRRVLVEWPLRHLGLDSVPSWMHLVLHGSGISYNWDTDGDLDANIWVDTTDPNAMTIDEIKEKIGPYNNLPLDEMGVDSPEAMQYFLKEGTGTDMEVLGEQPYSAYDLDGDRWLKFPDRFDPEFYAKWFNALEDRAEAMARDINSWSDSYDAAVADWTYWDAMVTRDPDNQLYEQARLHARIKGEKALQSLQAYRNTLFKDRQRAYSPGGHGLEDRRDQVQKLLEVWGVLQKLKEHFIAVPPWRDVEVKTATWPHSSPDTLFHVSDPRHRESILRSGLRGVEFGTGAGPNPDGNYLREEGQPYLEEDRAYPHYDIWRVDAKGLRLEADSSDSDRSWFTSDVIPPERLTLDRPGIPPPKASSAMPADMHGHPLSAGQLVSYAGDLYHVSMVGLHPTGSGLTKDQRFLPWDEVIASDVSCYEPEPPRPRLAVVRRVPPAGGSQYHPGSPMDLLHEEHRATAEEHLAKYDLSVEQMTQHVVNFHRQIEQEAPEEIEEAARFYHTQGRRTVDEIAGIHAGGKRHFTEEQAAGTISALSPQNPWERPMTDGTQDGNKQQAIKYAHAVAEYHTTGKITVSSSDVRYANELRKRRSRFAVVDGNGNHIRDGKGNVVTASGTELRAKAHLEKKYGEGAHYVMHRRAEPHGLKVGEHSVDSLSTTSLAHLPTFRSTTGLRERKQAIGILRGEIDPIRELDPHHVHRDKQGAFMVNCLEPDHPDAVTVDVHAINVAFGRLISDDELKKFHAQAPSRTVEYEGGKRAKVNLARAAIVTAYQEAGRRLGYPAASHAQAAVWSPWRKRHPLTEKRVLPKAAADQKVPEEPSTSLSATLRAFAEEGADPLTRTMQGAYDKGHEINQAFVDAAVQAGHPDVSLLELHGAPEEGFPNAHPRWQGIEPEDWTHFVVRVDGRLVDWAARQFDPKSPWPSVTKEDDHGWARARPVQRAASPLGVV